MFAGSKSGPEIRTRSSGKTPLGALLGLLTFERQEDQTAWWSIWRQIPAKHEYFLSLINRRIVQDTKSY